MCLNIGLYVGKLPKYALPPFWFHTQNRYSIPQYGDFVFTVSHYKIDGDIIPKIPFHFAALHSALSGTANIFSFFIFCFMMSHENRTFCPFSLCPKCKSNWITITIFITHGKVFWCQEKNSWNSNNIFFLGTRIFCLQRELTINYFCYYIVSDLEILIYVAVRKPSKTHFSLGKITVIKTRQNVLRSLAHGNSRKIATPKQPETPT